MSELLALDAWRARFADLRRTVLGAPTLVGLELAALATRPCLELAARSADTADALRDAGAGRIWLADHSALLPDFHRRRAILGEPHWLHDHPALHDLRGEFALVVCATGLWRALDPVDRIVRRTLESIRVLMAPGATLRLALPAARAPSTPRVRAFDASGNTCEHEHAALLVVDQHVAGVRHELRFTPHQPPLASQGPDLAPEDWALELDAAGFDLVRIRDLDHEHVLVTARKTAPSPDSNVG